MFVHVHVRVYVCIKDLAKIAGNFCIKPIINVFFIYLKSSLRSDTLMTLR